MVGLGDRATHGRDAMAQQHQQVGVMHEVLHRRDVGLDIDARRHVGRGLAENEGHVERQHLHLLEPTGTEERDRRVVVHVNDGLDVGPQAHDLPREVVPDAGDARARQDLRARDLRYDEVLRPHLLEADAGMLRVGHAVVAVVGVRGTDHHVAERVVDVAAGRHHAGVAQELLDGTWIEGNGCRHRNLPLLQPASPMRGLLGGPIIARHASLRSTSSIDAPSGPRRKQMRTPGRLSVGSIVNSAPLALSSATRLSRSSTRRPKWSRPW